MQVSVNWDPWASWLSWQKRVWKQHKRFNVLAKGRRTGGSSLCEDVAILKLLNGGNVGWFSGTNKILADSEREIVNALRANRVLRYTNATDSYYQLANAAAIEMWSFESKMPGRAREYDLVVIDEGAHVPNLKSEFDRGIRPGIAKTQAEVWFPSSPNGFDDFKLFWDRGHDETRPSWASWQIPTTENPFIPASEIEEMKRDMDEGAFRQEVMAEFVLRAGAVFKDFNHDKHVRSLPIDPDLPIHMGIDFGYRVYAAVWFQVTKHGIIHILGDVEYREMQPDAALLALASIVLPDGKPLYNRLGIVGCDPAVGPGRLDYHMLCEAFPRADVRYSTRKDHKNPEWRAGMIRSMLLNARNEVRMLISPDATGWIRILENSVYPEHKDGHPMGQEPVKDGVNDHKRDAGGYGLLNAVIREGVYA